MRGSSRATRIVTMLVAATHNDHLVQLVAAFGPALQAGLQAATRHGWEWPDFLEFRDNEIQYYMNAMADLLKQVDIHGTALGRHPAAVAVLFYGFLLKQFHDPPRGPTQYDSLPAFYRAW